MSTDLSEASGESSIERGDQSAEPSHLRISKDDAFHVLQNTRRRAVLRYLLADPETDAFEMRDLTEEVAAWEHDTTVRRLTSDQRQRVYIALYQSHLPKLDDYDVIDYNQPRGIVEPTPLISVFEPFLEEGLHAKTDGLTSPDGGPSAGGGDDGTRGNIAHSLSSVLSLVE